MVPLTSLWLPTILSAVIVFIASSILHMVLTYHRADYKKVAGEERVMEVMRTEGVAPGHYMFPHAAGPKDLNLPEVKAKFVAGPVGILRVLPSGPPSMGKPLGQWFGFTVLVSIFAAYVAGRAVGPATEYLEVFRMAGTAAFLGYGLGEIRDSIWKGQPWSMTWKNLVDGLIYALLTAGTFGWLWPK